MTKSEIKNIINNGFQERRFKNKEKRARACAATKLWKLREKLIKSGLADPPAKRNKQYR